MPLKLIPMTELLEALDTHHPNLQCEIDRDWVWIISNLAPPHRNCACESCAQRAAIRKAIGKDGLGFIYAKRGHQCPSGAMAFWGNHCTHPIKFHHRRKSAAHQQTEAQTETATTTTGLSDEQLLAIIGD